MLTKMLKITDLMSKLDCFAQGEDKTRVSKNLGFYWGPTVHTYICKYFPIIVDGLICVVHAYDHIVETCCMHIALVFTSHACFKCHCVPRCIENLESKLAAAQTAYDKFVASRAELGDGSRSSPNPGLNKFQH